MIATLIDALWYGIQFMLVMMGAMVMFFSGVVLLLIHFDQQERKRKR